MKPVWNIFSLMVWILVIGCTGSHDCLIRADDQEDVSRCTLSKAIAAIFRADEVKIKPAESRCAVHVGLNYTRNVILAISTRFTEVCHGAYHDVVQLRWGKAVLEFLLGCTLTSICLTMVTSWTSRPEDGLYERMTQNEDGQKSVSSFSSKDVKKVNPCEQGEDPGPEQEETAFIGRETQQTENPDAETTEGSNIKTEDTYTETEDTDTKTEQANTKIEDTYTKTQDTDTKTLDTDTKTEDTYTKTMNANTDTLDTDTKTEDIEIKTELKANSLQEVRDLSEGLFKEVEQKEDSGQYSEAEQKEDSGQYSEAADSLNAEINSDSEGCASLGENTEDSSRELRPFRPSSPTVRVFSLHKPQEIPNDVMDALLCLKKSCSHDHTKIRIIGPKVIVYSTAKSNRARAKRRTSRLGVEQTSAWRPGRTSPAIIGQQVLSDNFELEEDTSTASTQTDTLGEPRTLVIRTEAFMCEETTSPTYNSRGSMTGTLLIAKDSFETKFVGKSWSQSQMKGEEAGNSLTRGTCSNVRESIIRSRPNIVDLEEHFADLDIELGHPQAHSSISEDYGQDEATKQQEDELLNRTHTEISLHNASAMASLTSSACQDGQPVNWEGDLTPPRARRKRDLNDFVSCDKPRNPSRHALSLARSLTYLGSEMGFYEKLSLIMADIAIQSFSSSSDRSMIEARQNTSSPARLSKTL